MHRLAYNEGSLRRARCRYLTCVATIAAWGTPLSSATFAGSRSMLRSIASRTSLESNISKSISVIDYKVITFFRSTLHITTVIIA